MADWISKCGQEELHTVVQLLVVRQIVTAATAPGTSASNIYVVVGEHDSLI